MNTRNYNPAQDGINAARQEKHDSDYANPEFLFSVSKSSLVCDIANRQIDVVELAKQEMANRGLGLNGEWVGFEKAKKIWNLN